MQDAEPADNGIICAAAPTRAAHARDDSPIAFIQPAVVDLRDPALTWATSPPALSAPGLGTKL